MRMSLSKYANQLIFFLMKSSPDKQDSLLLYVVTKYMSI